MHRGHVGAQVVLAVGPVPAVGALEGLLARVYPDMALQFVLPLKATENLVANGTGGRVLPRYPIRRGVGGRGLASRGRRSIQSLK